MKNKTVKKLKLKSIDEEAAACRKAFKSIEVGAFTLHCHHESLGETLREDAENRIAYILSSKSQHEQALRLRLFRPIPIVVLNKLNKFKAYAYWQKAYADWQKADADWQKADADWQKADWQKADADADWQKADWEKAYADWKKADADWQKADADLALLVHTKVCHPSCPWDGKTIFPKK